ncbi:hypothetical protein EVAR_50406_1 [Eumeta japonica]|uniref:Uncharacterized protein n=1 Tax=Eumeta variegata TaxID=151549 RepID=A0A4C1WWE7_EUMVA|nr:hypothetical protein EVAR_50406_1 [Eumeta japonica]
MDCLRQERAKKVMVKSKQDYSKSRINWQRVDAMCMLHDKEKHNKVSHRVITAPVTVDSRPRPARGQSRWLNTLKYKDCWKLTLGYSSTLPEGKEIQSWAPAQLFSGGLRSRALISDLGTVRYSDSEHALDSNFNSTLNSNHGSVLDSVLIRS